MRTTTRQNSFIAVSMLASVAMAAGVQQATEMFIPIGQSPNLSNKVTVIGTVESVDAAQKTIIVKTDSGNATATIAGKTHIYIDRSQRKETNRYGSFDDLKAGARVEVLYESRARAASGTAEWVKVELPSP